MVGVIMKILKTVYHLEKWCYMMKGGGVSIAGNKELPSQLKDPPLLLTELQKWVPHSEN